MFTGTVLFLADLFKRKQSFKLYCAFRTKRTAFSAAYTFRAVRIFQNFNLHRANALAPMTRSAFAFVNLRAEKAETVEQTVNSAERTEIFAKRTLDKYTKKKNNYQSSSFPNKQPTGSRPKALVQSKQ